MLGPLTPKWDCVVLRRYTYRFATNMVKLMPQMIADKPYQALPSVLWIICCLQCIILPTFPKPKSNALN